MSMHCFSCGDCCKRMSPISAPNPCPHLIEEDSFVFCGRYKDRPKQCVDHDFPASFCPVGADVLKIGSSEEKIKRLNEAYRRAPCRRELS